MALNSKEPFHAWSYLFLLELWAFCVSRLLHDCVLLHICVYIVTIETTVQGAYIVCCTEDRDHALYHLAWNYGQYDDVFVKC